MATSIIPGLLLDRAALDRARKARDVRFDGRFFAGSLITGVYCRPICPTRTAKPENTRYFPTAAAAAEAGFRPCLRCRPEAAPESPAWLGPSAVVRSALRLIDNGALDEGSVEELARRLGIGSRHLRGLFVEHVGASPITVAQTRRLHFAKRLIDGTDMPMTQVAMEAGYGSLRRFNAAVRQGYRRTPSELRRHARRNDNRVDMKQGGIVLRLPYRPPYDWQGVLEHLGARAVPEVERIDGDRYLRNIVQDGKPARIAVRAPRGSNLLELEFQGEPSGTLFDVVARARRVFDLAVDPERVASALRRDPLLAPLVARYPGLRIPGAWNGFECAVRTLLSGDIPGRERPLVARIVRSCGSRFPGAAESGGPTHLFPTAQSLVLADLETLGLAGSQAAAIRALAEAFLQYRLDFDGPSHELVTVLVGLPGIDESTAELIAFRVLADPDGFPANGSAFRVITSITERHGTATLARRSRMWRPWRGYAALYLWRAEGEERGNDPAAGGRAMQLT